MVALTAQQLATEAITAPAAVTGVVTFVEAKAGSTLKSADVLLRLNGRPLFVLGGSFALYRTTEPGDTGDDVRALQRSLNKAGYTVPSTEGTYDAATQEAVAAMYRDAGYEAPKGDPSTADSKDSGVRVLQNEVIMVSGLSATVDHIAKVGTQLGDGSDLMTLASGDFVLSTTLPAGSTGALTVGAVGTFTDDAAKEATAEVTAIEPTESGDETVVSMSSIGGIAAISSVDPSDELTEGTNVRIG